MNDILPSLFLMAAGGCFWLTATRPDHANPRAAKVIGSALIVLGVGALIYSLISRFPTTIPLEGA